MQHRIVVESLSESEGSMATAIEACVHCGFCLPACPTYLELGEEMDSPRGRIFLMKEVLEGSLTTDAAAPYVDRCLGCLGCVTACPSGVEYDALITLYRARAERTRKRGIASRVLRAMLLRTLPYPFRFRWALRFSMWFRPLLRWMPGRFGALTQLVPQQIPSAVVLPECMTAQGPQRGRVAMLSGCAQQVLAPEINMATMRVLAVNGIEVVVPPEQVCCGALAAHTGAMQDARRMAEKNIEVFPHDVDAVITNAAGCGSGLKEYPMWLRGESRAASEFSTRALDVSEYLCDIGIKDPPAWEGTLRVAYHDACHLVHGQQVRNSPREILRRIPGVQLVEIPESDLCCGSAGTYSLEQPELANSLGERKAKAILSTEPDVVVMGNIGCMTQVDVHLRNLASSLRVRHTVELLDAAYRGTLGEIKGG